MRLSQKVILATLNVDKYREFEELLKAEPGIELVPVEAVLRNAEKLKHAEIHSTYLENAIAKARLANQGAHYPALADDTGLEVEALEGRPGVKTFRYAPLPSHERSREAQDRANIELLLKELHGKTNRNARFVTTVALLIEGILVTGTGVLEGSIADAPRGSHGFGYDSVFVPKGTTKTLAEMTNSEKNAISHRGRAIHDLLIQVRGRGIVLAKP